MSNPTGTAPVINVTPLIDVLLVLLIVFMIIAPTRPGQIEAKIPSRPDPRIKEVADPSVLVVTLGKGRQLTLNGTTLTEEELTATLANALQGRSDRTVILRAPTGLPYSQVMQIVDAVKGAGAMPLGLQIDFLEG